jgi:enoyl-[acyl-carrier protein] reductase I
MANSLEGRVAVIFGLANKRSIAWAIAQKLHADGAQIAITYQNERLRQEAEEMITSLPGAQGFQCDVTNDEEITNVFQQISDKYNGKIHTLVHSVAFAPAGELKNDFLLTSREGFHIAHDISVYSLIALARGAAPLMTDGGSIITLTYLGSEKVMQNYNVMGVAKAALEATMRYLAASLGSRGIRVNAISAGPIKTLAARGVSNFSDILKIVSDRAPLKRNVDPSEVGATAAFLASDGASAITGEVIHVDCGYNVMGF